MHYLEIIVIILFSTTPIVTSVNKNKKKYTSIRKVSIDIQKESENNEESKNEIDSSLSSPSPRKLLTSEEKEAFLNYRNFFGPGDNKYAVYPSYWKDSWGKKPILGIVFADNEFLAEKLAYDIGILPTPFNCTFQPNIVYLGANKNKRWE